MERSEEGEGEDREGDGGLNVAPIVATVEEIQQRLIRPPLPFPFWSACDESRCRSSRPPPGIQIGADGAKRLEDYLDPVLLAVVSSRIWGRGGDGGEKAVKRRGRRSPAFEWPVGEWDSFRRGPPTVKRRVAPPDGDTNPRGGRRGATGDLTAEDEVEEETMKKNTVATS